MILSILVSGGGTRRFGLKGGKVAGINKCSSNRNKREMRGSISSLDGVCVIRSCENYGIDACGGVLNRGDGRKCCLGALYLGGGVTAVSVHLLSVDGTSIV